MNIALDISPLTTGHYLQHRVRGTGFYTENLKNALKTNFPENSYTYFSRGESLPKDIDIVHYPYFEPFFITLPFHNNFVSVVTIHDLTPLIFPDYFPSGLKGKVKWQIQKGLLKHMDAIITDSDASKKDIINIVGIDKKKVHTIYLAAGDIFQQIQDASRIKKIKQKYALPDRFALYVGDVTWNKNLPRLLQAIQKTSIPLVLVGKALTETTYDKKNQWNQDRQVVEQLIKQNNRIRILGFVENDDLVTLYNSALFFIMPSLYEGFGLPILEAMCCGCPVITTHEGSLKEVVGDAAYIVDGYSLNSIVGGIMKVASDSLLRKELAEKGQARAKEFSWKETAKKTVQVYAMIKK